MENKELVKKLKKGNKKAFKDIYSSYYSKLIQTAKRFEFKFLTPEDFVQETFLKIYNNREQLKEDVLFDKQLFVICKNIILNHLRRENKVIPINASILKSDLQEEDDFYEDFEYKKKQLEDLLLQLPEQQRKIFILHKLKNYSYQEIAEITQLSPKTIANHIYLANKFLQKKIANA
ncbi:sigma-70 family RNA polymerase sigma factor [Flavivirga sp. 57AJ16]|uniref:sigma-70 family RNA polymerase sigma factor n=1 Tax=Flavivirga sp. 57AJ16 TaxID=3025307 RepID=UPI00236534A3|nr:sigma-70 family RNA polymerase sigma factor [Flavivirga sp. 57AJ16]MDD7886766.1 sigma-70 family RNA polymerase sigma factor [Flavivirga sp. 57AJ16]